MFKNAARQYWQLKCQVGHGATLQGTKLFGLGCRLSPTHVLTAFHLVSAKGPRVLLGDGLWNCDLEQKWVDRDLALLRITSVAKQLGPADEQQPVYPSVSSENPFLGASLGYLASLSLTSESGESSSHTYFGHGHVAFFTQNSHKQLVFALAGGAIQKGFSGGPVFSSNGLLTGVLVEALQYVPDLGHPSRAANAVALFSPVAPIAKELASLVNA
jgi:hypothetical protein